MNILKSSIIIAYYLIVTISVIYFHKRLEKKTGNKVGGSIDFKQIPKSLIWLPILSTLFLLFYIVFPFAQLFLDSFYLKLFPIPALVNTVTFIIALIFIPLGLILLIISQIQLGNAYRILLADEKSELVTSGVYSVTRNPLYLGAYLSFFGIFFLYPTYFFVLILLTLIVNNHFRILEEEKALLDTYGDEYSQYKNRVKRYLLLF